MDKEKAEKEAEEARIAEALEFAQNLAKEKEAKAAAKLAKEKEAKAKAVAKLAHEKEVKAAAAKLAKEIEE
jgi:hypothetical protein